MSFNELAVVFAVALSLVGLGLWARWLSKNTSAPRWLILLPAMLPVLASLLGIGLCVLGAYGGVSGDPSQKAHIHPEGLPEVMNGVVLGMPPALLVAGWMLGLTWRYRWSRKNQGTKG